MTKLLLRKVAAHSKPVEAPSDLGSTRRIGGQGASHIRHDPTNNGDRVPLAGYAPQQRYDVGLLAPAAAGDFDYSDIWLGLSRDDFVGPRDGVGNRINACYQPLAKNFRLLFLIGHHVTVMRSNAHVERPPASVCEPAVRSNVKL